MNNGNGCNGRLTRLLLIFLFVVIVLALCLMAALTILAFLYSVDNFNKGIAVDSRIWSFFWCSSAFFGMIVMAGVGFLFRRNRAPEEWKQDL